jgi:hypothetical protein
MITGDSAILAGGILAGVDMGLDHVYGGIEWNAR